MIRYFNNKMLSKCLSINLAKWKRWSREFLPPDPLGGMQSGFARHYTPDEAFRLYLAGCLVSQLHFSIPDTRQILTDLHPWLMENGFRFDTRNSNAIARSPGNTGRNHYMIFIMPVKNGIPGASSNTSAFFYIIRCILSENSRDDENNSYRTEHFTETCLPPSASHPFSIANMHPLKVLNITYLFHEFIKALDIETDKVIFSQK